MKEQVDERTLKVLSGRFCEDEEANIPVRIVRVYLACNGTDTITERTLFIQNVYPRLREYCRQQYGVEFQVVDLEWGLSSNQFVPDSFKRNEIRKCQKMSTGPSLIMFLGQKYGSRVLPTIIPADEFEKIRDTLQQHNSRDTRTACLLDDWFIQDYNNLPSVYMLKEPTDYFNTDGHQNNPLRENFPETTEEAKTEILRLLEKGTKLLNVNDTSPSGSASYQVSELERNLHFGLDYCDYPDKKCILILRQIIDLHNYVDEDIISRFVDLQYDENEDELRPCEQSKMRLDLLKLKAMNVVAKDNIITHDVLWRYNQVISPELHCEYLSDLCQEVFEHLKFQIDSLVPCSTTNLMPQTELMDEVSRHWTRCLDVASRFYGRRDILSKLYSYLHNNSNCPLLIHGPSGCGKTKLISKVATETHRLLGFNTITIVRFIGYTVGSSTSRQLWLGVCKQICIALGLDYSNIPDESTALYKYLHQLLEKIPETFRLVIYLDAMELLSSDSEDPFCWLPKHYPHNVNIIITVHSESTRVISRLMERISTPSCCVEIVSLNVDECTVLLTHFLARLKRAITSKQMLQLRYVFQKCSAPIFVKLLANQLKTCKSFEDINIDTLPTSINEALDSLLIQLENKHGSVFVAKCLGYLVASKTGLSDCEMEDILSLDDEVLNEVYMEYQPPLRRIPSVKWLYLKDSLEGFLCSFDTDGVTVNIVKHTCLIQSITERYLNTEDYLQKQHSVLADYFLGFWANVAKPVNPSLADPMFSSTEEERFVLSQPLTFRTNELTRFNKRKYDQLPRHLKGAERMHEMNRLIFFNYGWIYNKMKALSLEHILEDFALNPSEEASLVQEALRQAQPTLEIDINNLGPEIIGRLLPYYSEFVNIQNLIKQCELDGLPNCCFIPNLPYSNTPGSALKSTMTCPVVPEFFALVMSDKKLVCKKREDCYVYIYDVATGKCKDKIFASNGDLYTTPNGEFLVIVDHVTEAAIKVHETNTGRFVGQIIVMPFLEDSESGVLGQISLSNDMLCTYVSAKNSYLCFADLQVCKVSKVIKMEGKIRFCKISPDFRFVFCNSDDQLYCYDLKTCMESFNMSLDFLPCSVDFCHDMSLVYVIGCNSSIVRCMTWGDFGLDLLSKCSMEDETNGFPIEDIRVSRNNSMMLARSKNAILLYDKTLQTLHSKYLRPVEIPQEFRLPKSQYQNLFFSDAQFSCDDRFVLGAIFRVVYIWLLGADYISSVQAPVGIIKSLLVSRENMKFITHAEGLHDIQVWDISAATRKIINTDKLTNPVKKIEVNSAKNLIFIQCHKSDEIGIIDMKTGIVIDLLTHANNVEDFSITPSGNYILVTMEPRLSNSAVNLWDTRSRTIIREFGNSVVKCIPCHQKEIFYFMAQDELSYVAPYFLHYINFEENCINQQKHHIALKYLLSEPFFTPDDNYLVALSAEQYKENTGEYLNTTICIFSLSSDMNLTCHSPETIPTPHDIGSFVALKPCPALDNTIAIIYQPRQSKYNNVTNETQIGICLFDIRSGRVTDVFHPLLCTVNKTLISHQVFSDDFTLCLTKQGTLVNLKTRRESHLVPFSNQRLLAVKNTVVVYHEGSVLYAYRITNKAHIGTCEVHCNICYLKMCSDDHTILVGCMDGTVTSYTVISYHSENPQEIIHKIASRPSVAMDKTSEFIARSWDRLEKDNDTICPRPPTARSFGPKDKLHLQCIEPLPMIRPPSAGSTYSIANSKTCIII